MRNAIFLLSLVLTGSAAELRSDFDIGRSYYAAGDFKNAARHFQRAVNAAPQDAEAYYWAGLSQQGLSDMAAPFDAHHRSKTCAYLTKAIELAPSHIEYRRALFEFWLDSADTSRHARRQAERVLRSMQDDPEYSALRRSLEDRTVNRPGLLFMASQRTLVKSATLGQR